MSIAEERHTSPDGKLVWLINRYRNAADESDAAMGFEGAPWHIHPDLFMARGRSLEQIVHDVTAQLLHDRLLIMTIATEGQVEHQLMSGLEFEVDFKRNDENWSFRFWSGRTVTIEELIEGRVTYLPLEDA